MVQWCSGYHSCLTRYVGTGGRQFDPGLNQRFCRYFVVLTVSFSLQPSANFCEINRDASRLVLNSGVRGEGARSLNFCVMIRL